MFFLVERWGFYDFKFEQQFSLKRGLERCTKFEKAAFLSRKFVDQKIDLSPIKSSIP